MRTADALKIGMALGRISKTLDAWEESKHPRADNGQFSSSSGGGGDGRKEAFAKATKKVKAQRAEKEKANKKQAKKVLADIDDRISKAKQDGDYKKVVFLQATKNKYKDMLK